MPDEELPQPEPNIEINTDVEPESVDYDPTVIAREVVAGRWGRGNRRNARLRAAGYDPDLIAVHVNNIFNQAP